MQSATDIQHSQEFRPKIAFRWPQSFDSLAGPRVLLDDLVNTLRPNNIISSAVAVDLAGHPKLAGTRSLGTVTGIINGSGSIVAALGESLEITFSLHVLVGNL